MIAQRIKTVPVVGPIAVGVKRLLRSLWRSQSIFGKANRARANMRRFRMYVASVPARHTQPLFVKVGANDGVTGDPCTDLLTRDESWRGVLIEPVPYIFEKLEHNFPDRDRFKLFQVAIGSPGKATFYYLDPAARNEFPGLPDWFDQIGSFERQHITKHFGAQLDAYVREVEIDVEPLSSVLGRCRISECDLLHIDTEGHDYKVLATLDFERVSPAAVFVEHKHLTTSERAALVRTLEGHGYRVRDCGNDFFALRETSARKRAGC